MKIPKIIHYCWFGGKPLPELAVKCIASWKKYLPEYEIKEWNESNFDVDIIPYTSEAYKAKKYAFVSDYARFWILYKYGGIYFDTDVEVIRPLDDIIARGPFMGCEKEIKIGPVQEFVAPGLGLGVYPNLGFYNEILKYYSHLSFIKKDGSYNQATVVEHVTGLFVQHGLKFVNEIQECSGIYIYPKEYFCPLDYKTGKLYITENTYTIHHYMASWHTKGQKMYILFKNVFGENLAQVISKFLKKHGFAK